MRPSTITTDSRSTPAPAPSTELPSAPGALGIRGAAQRVNTQHTALYFRQMHALLAAGVTLTSALEEMSQCGASRALRTASKEMSRQVASGQPWSTALRTYPGFFSELMIASISAAERSGSLERMCLRLSQYAEAEYRLQQAIKRETWYPKLLLFFSTVMVPLPISLSFGGQVYVLGFGTQLLLIAVPWGVWKLANFVWPVGARAGAPRYWIDRLKWKLPGTSKTARSLAIAKFCRTFGLLQAAGMGVSPAVERAADACGNVILADRLRGIIPRLQRGETLTATLASTGDFPQLTLQLLGTGEATGAVDEMLQKAADFLEADAQITLQKSVKTLGVIVFLLVAVKIGVQVIQWWQAYSGQ